MLKYLQSIGRSLMVPIAVLPAAALLMGIGYWIDPSGWGGDSQVAAVLIKSGSALIDNMGILFAVGLAFGLSKDKHGSAALSGLVGWLVVQTLLAPDAVSIILGVDPENVDIAFTKVNTQFIGILVGVMSAEIYNRTYQVELAPALSFFSGRRFSAICVSVAAVILSVILYIVWPMVFGWLTSFGEFILSLNAFGAGLYGMFNRLLIPLGLHHALNSVFWFDVAGINDIPNYLSGVGEKGVTGMYQAGFFPIMMFGLPAAAYAMYREALPSQKSKAGGLLLAGAVASFFTGVTEPLEFAFMFVAPPLFVMHAIFTGISLFIAAQMQWIAGFGFSAGFVDYFLSFKNPLAVQNYMLLVQGLGFAALYFFSFTFMIRKFDFKTPGRTEGEFDEVEVGSSASNGKKDYAGIADKMLTILDPAKVQEVNNCTTRLRLVVDDSAAYNDADFKQLGMLGVMRPSKNDLQVVVGPDVEFLAEALKVAYEKAK